VYSPGSRVCRNARPRSTTRDDLEEVVVGDSLQILLLFEPFRAFRVGNRVIVVGADQLGEERTVLRIGPQTVNQFRVAGRAGLADLANLADADGRPRPSRVGVACELSIDPAVNRASRARLVGVAHAVTARCLEQLALLRVHS